MKQQEYQTAEVFDKEYHAAGVFSRRSIDQQELRTKVLLSRIIEQWGR
jgi:hypothetical protein